MRARKFFLYMSISESNDGKKLNEKHVRCYIRILIFFALWPSLMQWHTYKIREKNCERIFIVFIGKAKRNFGFIYFWFSCHNCQIYVCKKKLPYNMTSVSFITLITFLQK